ncbi:MAG: MBL fold metallo-hydrolase [Lachnospira sp.]|nr:MBL fold metallo-hydrolase [Lachnospira sp.]
MQITFLGANHEVTGSCHYLNVAGKNILIDCGMEQGTDVYENQSIPVNPVEVDYVLLTHAHIDHSGLIPLLYVNGFRGQIYTTEATCDLCNIMLRDSAHIQMFEAEWRNRKAKRSGYAEFVPLYDMEAVEAVLKHFVPCEYDTQIALDDGITIRFTDVGHLLGSASIEIWVKENSFSKKIVFSGDIGNLERPLIRNPKYIKEADYVIMESTYGNRIHKAVPNYEVELANIIKRTFDRGGNVVIPAFAVGRTQEMLYYIQKIKRGNLVPEYADFEVYVDSPLAVEATNIFNRNIDNCFDEEALEMIRKGINPIKFPGLKLSITSSDSKAINYSNNSKVIISASGMCEAGRIRHHLKHNLWRPESTILFVGYQSTATLGRALLDGAKQVKLFAETIEVRAEITTLDGVSGHADKNGLIQWLQAFEKKPKKVFVVHGEDSVCEEFAECLRTEYNYNVEAPYTGATYDLISNECLVVGNTQKKERRKNKPKRTNEVYERLLAAGRRLMAVIAHNQHGANKDLAKFADQIDALSDKWDR